VRSDLWRESRQPFVLVVILLATGGVTAGAQRLMATFASADTAAHQRRFGDAARL
jgi:hypothetical protein